MISLNTPFNISPILTVDDDGGQRWLIAGVYYHREDGPAYIAADGSQHWFRYDQRHREGAPAIIRPNGNRVWWVNGKNITESVEKWMRDREVTWPFDEETEVEFRLSYSYEGT